MEHPRNVQRINGERTHLHQLTLDELNQERSYAAARIHAGMEDIEKIEGEIATRRTLSETMLHGVVHLEVTQVVQTGFNQRTAEL